MKQTAIEWFFKWFNDNPEATHKEYAEAFEQAKEMEKEQIISAVDSVELTNRYYYRSGDGFGDDNAGKEIQLTGREYIGLSVTGEQYYNKIFKSE